MDSDDEEEGPTLLPNEHLFELNKLVSAKDIKMSARCVTGRRQLLALIMGSGDITFHYQTGELNQLPVMKLVPWFLDVNKKICAICFSPDANWLVVIAHDGSIHIVPALPLVDTTASFDHRWSISDVTSFPYPYLGSTVTPCPKKGCPTSIVWWQSAQEYHQTVIVGNDLGEIRFFSLTSEKQVGITYVKEAILSLHICEDNTLETVFLLITSKDRSQWKVVLEQNASSYYWSVDESKKSVSTQEVTFITNNSIDVELMSRRSSHLPTARSRLQGLKQLSVEKLASLRHKLAETRSKGIVASIADSSHSKQDGSTSSSEEIPSKPSTARDSSQYVSSGPLPERLSTQVGETYLHPQFAKGRYLLSGYYSPTSILTIHSMSLEVIPLFVYKLPENCWDILYTDKFMFITSRERNTVTVVSCVLAESRLDGDTDYNPDSIVETFTFPVGEEVLAIYKNSDLSRCSETKRASSKHKNSQQSATFTLPKDIKDINIDAPPVDLCLIVTSAGIYEITLRQPASEIFMELVLTYQELEKAEKIAVMFGLNLQELLELAGDLKLAAEEFPQAITLYKLSRCRYLKSVLKFAAAGHTTELLSYIKVLLSTTNLDLSVSEKIHLSNLAVMSYTEQVLRNIDNKAVLLKHFLEFLGSNLSYDEVLAVNVVGQTGLWQVLQFLASYRGLHMEVLDVLGKLLRTHNATFNTKEHEDTGFKLDKWVPLLEPGLWTFISEPSLLQAMLVKAPDFRTHLRFVELCLTHLQLFALQRLAALYDPSSPLLRPNLIRMFKSPCRRLHSSSLLNSFNTDLADTVDEFIVPTEETIQMFLLVLLYLNKKQSTIHTYDPSLMDRIQITQENDEDLDDFLPSLPVQVCKLSSGFAHSALVRNGTVYTWGNAVQGCLGTGPTLSRYNPPQPVSLFPSLRLEIFSVACGRQHTLALTNNGVYSWGSSQYGQLGVGVTGQCPYPRLVERLCKEVVVSVCAGQYHSLALVKDGRVFTWGWGVHGQLGHGSIEDCHYPKLVDKLVGKVIVQVCGGHGHSLALSAEGEVYSFGSSVFGQLGTGTNLKSCVPQQVILLPERICMIATGYFHNLAVSILNKLYIWGSSPQVLRLQAQAQKKVRLLQQQPPMTSSGPEKLQLSPTKNTPVTKGTFTNLRTDPSSPETNQNNATLQIKVNNRKFPSKTVRETRNDPMSRAINNSEVDIEVYDDVYSSNSSSRTPVCTNEDSKSFNNNINLNGASSPTHQYSSTSIEDGQTHLIPQLVDTSLVVGAIMQISCGCHHSALLTKEGVLYIWGRNLDGQIGNGSRREVPIPTPLSTSTANLKSLNSKTSISGAIPSIGERLRLQQVCCGSEFTTALESTGGKVWAWGSNSQGQLGKTPNEDTRELEGKLVMLKTTKRVIKLPHGSGNSNDVPKEVPGIPSTTISFRTGNFENHNWEQGSDRAAPIPGVCQSLCTIEFPCYGQKTLHYVLEYFHGFYDSNYIIKKSLELENYQCAAKLVTLDRHYHAAVTYQLKALALATFYPEIAVAEPTSVEESKPCIHSPDHDTSFTSSHLIDNTNTDIFPNMERLLEKYEASLLKKFHSNEPTCTESDDKLFSSNLGSKKCSNIFRNLDVSNKSASDDSMNSDLKIKDKDTSSELSRDERSITSTPDSEMHTFSVQGGHEQMSDSNQGISTPDTSQDASHSNLSELKQNQLGYDITNQVPNISHGHKGKNTELSIEMFSNSMEKCESDSLTPVPENKPITPQSHNISTNSTCGNGISEKCLKENSDKVDKTSQSNIRLSDTNTNFLSNNVLTCSNMEGLSSVTTSISQSGHSSVTRLGSAPISESSVKLADLMAQASLIVEFYVSMMEEDSHTMMSSLLQQGIEFWLEHSLPMDHLENVLRKHMAKFFYPLGLLLFCKASMDSCKDENKDSKQDMSLLNNLSTKFSLQLCSTLLTHIEQKKIYPEYIDLLVQLSSIETSTTASSGVFNGFCKSASSELFSQEQLIESVLQRLGCSVHLGHTMEQPSIDVREKLLVPAPLDGVTPECLFVFSCGHNYSSHILQEEVLPELESRLQPLPNTARMLKEVYNADSPSIHLACPRCLLEYLKIHTDMVM